MIRMVKAMSGITEQASIPSVNTLIEKNVHRQKLTQKKISPTAQLLQSFYLSPRALNPTQVKNLAKKQQDLIRIDSFS